MLVDMDSLELLTVRRTGRRTALPGPGHTVRRSSAQLTLVSNANADNGV